MSIDKETKLDSLFFEFSAEKKVLDILKKDYKQSNPDESGNGLSITGDNIVFDSPEEFYFDSDFNKLEYSGSCLVGGEKAFVGFSIPLSDKVLIDILGHSIKKLNKLKVALESLN